MIAEGATWLATGGSAHDESEPMGRVLARMDEVVPCFEHYDWLMTPREDLDGKRPMDFVNADELEPLQALLDAMPEVNGSGNGAG